MGSLDTRTFVITGANIGIGRVTAEALTDLGASVIIACRSRERSRDVIDSITAKHGSQKVRFVSLDLGSLADVRRAAGEILAMDLPLHALINNAGVAGTRGQTTDGFEIHFGINHLGHFLLTLLLLDRIVASAPSRIISVSSGAHLRATGIPFDQLRGPTRSRLGLSEYGVSKLANVMFVKSLAARLHGTGVTTYALHPGVVASDIWRQVPTPFRQIMKLGMLSNEQGAETSIFCAAAPAVAAETGLYYEKCAPKDPNPIVFSDAITEALWQHSAHWTDIDWTPPS